MLRPTAAAPTAATTVPVVISTGARSAAALTSAKGVPGAALSTVLASPRPTAHSVTPAAATAAEAPRLTMGAQRTAGSSAGGATRTAGGGVGAGAGAGGGARAAVRAASSAASRAACCAESSPIVTRMASASAGAGVLATYSVNSSMARDKLPSARSHWASARVVLGRFPDSVYACSNSGRAAA
jgi:hypothetical protein